MGAYWLLIAIVLVERPEDPVAHSSLLVEQVNLRVHHGKLCRRLGSVQCLDGVASNPGTGTHPTILGGDYDVAGEE